MEETEAWLTRSGERPGGGGRSLDAGLGVAAGWTRKSAGSMSRDTAVEWQRKRQAGREAGACMPGRV